MSLEIFIGADIAPVGTAEGEMLASGLSAAMSGADARVFCLGGMPAGNDNTSPSPLHLARAAASLHPTAVNLGCADALPTDERLKETLAAFRAAGIPAFGAGEDLDAADQPRYFVKNGVRICFYTVSEHGGLTATERSGGVNPLNLLDLGDRIRDLRSSCERLVVFYRGGRDGYAYPTPEMQRVCRKIAECGASLVVCTGGRMIGSYEKWDNAVIVCGLGDFVSPADGEALLVKYAIGDYGAEEINFVPVLRKGGTTELAEEERAKGILDSFERRSRRVRVQGFVEARYRDYAADAKRGLLDALNAHEAGALKRAIASESSCELLAEGLRQDAI